jgi:hypothetical protein
MNKILTDLKILSNERENSLVKNLTRQPLKEPRDVMPHTTAPIANAVQQADLLHLPNDDGYKYLLVVVDIATRRTDAEPLKTKESSEVQKALQKIYKRKILKQPLRLEVDPGKEFQGAFKRYFDKLLEIVTKIVGRHRQQSVVETKNFQIGKILNTRMLVEEMNNNETSRSWVDILPEVIKSMNKHLSHPPVQTNVDAPIKTNAFTADVLPIGTRVRIQLDNPQSYVEDKPLHGKFRTGDIRWTKTVHTITQYYLRPAQPPMYQVDNNTKVAYTKYQLQVVKPDEIAPSTSSQNKFVVKKLLKRLKLKNKIYFEVLWGDNSITNEPRTNLIKDIPLLVKQFESKISK